MKACKLSSSQSSQGYYVYFVAYAQKEVDLVPLACKDGKLVDSVYLHFSIFESSVYFSIRVDLSFLMINLTRKQDLLLE